MFTILVTIPAALLTGAWMYKIRRAGGRGLGHRRVHRDGRRFPRPPFANSAWALLLFDPTKLKLMLPSTRQSPPSCRVGAHVSRDYLTPT